MNWMRDTTLGALFLMVAGCSSTGGAEPASTENLVSGDYLEGCECASVCPCLWEEDAPFGDCRAVFGWRIRSGSYNGVDLSGVSFAAALVKAGKNVNDSIGSLEGVMYLPEDATDAQRDAIGAMMTKQMEGAFSKMDVRVADVEFDGEDGRYELEIEDVAKLETRPLEGKNGEVPAIVNPPFAISLPINYCGLADVHTYDDGTNSWDFAGRNSFYGPFEIHHE
jgi:hypothetical protein